MPALEMAQETGKLVVWRKREGDAVRKGEPLMDVETDKAVVEVEAQADGILAGVRVGEGDVVVVGQTIAWILAPGEQVPVEEGSAPLSRNVARPVSGQAPAPPPSPPPVPSGDRPLMSPKARRLAAERGVARQSGSGPDGAVVAADFESATPSTDRVEMPSTVWRLMAERMSASWTTVPHFFVTRDVDAGRLGAAREAVHAGANAPEITYTDLLVVLAARALRSHPRMNASWTNGSVQRHDDIHIGIATGVEDGVVVPVIRDADRLTVLQVSERRRELVERARAGRLRPVDLADGTFTISNLGMYKIDAFSAIVNAPQASILAVGRIADRVVARDGQPVVRPMMALTLSCDHRVADGVRAAAFLSELTDLIEDAERWTV
jgi:pyruvate dehydrogenase E2 component (dihydrolipoamide acetyltransferase)